MPVLPITAMFDDIPDTRRETANKLHRLTDILAITTCAVIGGAETWEAAGIVPPPCRYGPWRYRSDNGESFNLSTGNYGKHGFVFFYRPASGAWYADT